MTDNAVTSDMTSAIRDAPRSFLASILTPILTQASSPAGGSLPNKPSGTIAHRACVDGKEAIYSPNYGEASKATKTKWVDEDESDDAADGVNSRDDKREEYLENRWEKAEERLVDYMKSTHKGPVVYVDGRDRDVVARTDVDMVRTIKASTQLVSDDRRVVVLAQANATLRLPKLTQTIEPRVVNVEYVRGHFVTVSNGSLTLPHVLEAAEGNTFQNNERSIRLFPGQTRALCGLGNTWVLV